MSIKIHIQSLLFVVLILSGCKEEKIDLDIESDILIERRVLNGKPELVASTVEQMGCANFKIKYSIQRDQDQLVIRFEEIIFEDFVCLTAIGPAMAILRLDEIPAGEYQVRFLLNGETTRGTLSTQPLALDIKPGGNVRLKP